MKKPVKFYKSNRFGQKLYKIVWLITQNGGVVNVMLFFHSIGVATPML
jgi:hypothetical protein